MPPSKDRKTPAFTWEVSHPDYETVKVKAPDRLHAIVEAAHAWGVTMWTDVAWECAAEIIGGKGK